MRQQRAAHRRSQLDTDLAQKASCEISGIMLGYRQKSACVSGHLRDEMRSPGQNAVAHRL